MDLTSKAAAVVRDCPSWIKSWYTLPDGRIVFVGVTGGELTLGLQALATLSHSAICEWVRSSAMEGLN